MSSIAKTHLLTCDHWEKDHIVSLLARANALEAMPVAELPQCLHQKTLVNLFYEPSTRTRVSFELAAKQLGAHVINIAAANSSVKKGETLWDTLETVQAMGVSGVVLRHGDHEAVKAALGALEPSTFFLNGGSGSIAHPSQALLDMLTIRQQYPDFRDLVVAIVGDIAHSRVARSDLALLRTLGVGECRLIAPEGLLPSDIPEGVSCYTELASGLQDVDVVMLLRLQKERMVAAAIPDEMAYAAAYGLTIERLAKAKPQAIVMHPGPMNRGVEIDDAVVNCPQSVIHKQVRNGVAVRMALLEYLWQQTQKIA